MYKHVLLTGHQVGSKSIRIGSTKHLLQAVRNHKFPPKAFDEKRFIHTDGGHGLPLGHLHIKDCQLQREIVENNEQGKRKPSVIQAFCLGSP